MRAQIFALIALTLAAIPAVSQDRQVTSEALCADKFSSIDTNKDRVLTVTEIPKVQEMPPGLEKETTLISRMQFMAACSIMPSIADQVQKSAVPSPHSTGQTVSPDTKSHEQPQGPTGPLETKTGGAPAESPQGQTPPGMQAAPDGSDKSIVDPLVKQPSVPMAK